MELLFSIVYYCHFRLNFSLSALEFYKRHRRLPNVDLGATKQKFGLVEASGTSSLRACSNPFVGLCFSLRLFSCSIKMFSFLESIRYDCFWGGYPNV